MPLRSQNDKFVFRLKYCYSDYRSRLANPDWKVSDINVCPFSEPITAKGRTPARKITHYPFISLY